jgi:predicted acylesterase/phospholipase RssA
MSSAGVQSSVRRSDDPARATVSDAPTDAARTGAEARPGSPFDAVVFAGGGCRCFWQAGFWSIIEPALGLAPDIVVGVSAGAAFACAAVAGRIEAVVEEFARRAAANARNVYLANLLKPSPVFPHENIYRSTILACLDTAAFARLQQGPDLRILIARPPASLGAGSGFVAGALAHVLDRRESRVHGRWGKRFGFEAEAVSVRTCPGVEALADLILHSSCAPPLVPLYRRGERIVLDGGLVDNSPADWAEGARRTLVLLSKRYGPAALPRVSGRLYVEPSRPIPIQKWDYTSPALIEATFDLGRRDAETLLARGALAPPGAAADGADAAALPESA